MGTQKSAFFHRKKTERIDNFCRRRAFEFDLVTRYTLAKVYLLSHEGAKLWLGPVSEGTRRDRERERKNECLSKKDDIVTNFEFCSIFFFLITLRASRGALFVVALRTAVILSLNFPPSGTEFAPFSLEVFQLRFKPVTGGSSGTVVVWA